MRPRSASHRRAVPRLTCTSCDHSSSVNDHPCRSNAWTCLPFSFGALKRITDDVDSISSFDELGLAQMPIHAMVSAIEPFVFATTAMFELSGPEGIPWKSSFIALSWTRTLSCICSAYNGHTQLFACPRCTTSRMCVTRAHAPHSRHVVRRISSAVPPAPCESVQMLPCIRKVRECETLLTGRDQSHHCPQVLFATPDTRSAPVEFPLLPGFMLRLDTCDTLSNFAL